MNLSDLTPETIERIRTFRYDRILEKHEGPESWDAFFRYHAPALLELAGHPVLLPVDADQHGNITLLRCIESADGQSLTLFFQDTTFYDDPLWSGRLAICDRFPGTEIYLATVYHEWFPTEWWVEV